MSASEQVRNHRRRNGVRYADDEARALLAPRLDELSRPARPNWQTVKHNASRTVYTGQINGQAVFLKHFHSQTPIHRLGRRLGFSDARTELEAMTYLRAHGVPTARPLAARWANRTEWLASKAVAAAQSADRWHLEQLSAGRQGRRRIQTAIRALAKLVGRMHAAGVVHRDLHCANVLVRPASEGRRLVLTDLHRIRRRRRLTRRARAANLAQLLHDRYFFTTRTERLRFLKQYLQACAAGGTLRGWQRLIEPLAHRYTARQHAQRDRRALGRNRYFAPVRPGRGWRGHTVLASKRRLAGSKAALLEFTPEQWREALADPDGLFHGPDVRTVKDSRSAQVVRRPLRVGPYSLDVYVKRSRRKRKRNLLVDCFRRARSIRAFRLGHGLLARRIATALPIAALERRTGPFLRDSILITEAVDAPRMNDFLRAHLARPPRGDVPLTEPQQRQLAQQVLWQLGRLLRNLHENRLAHRDLKATNMLVRWSARQSPELVLIDLDGLRQRRRLSTRLCFQGLMRLNVSLLKCPPVNHAGRLRMLLGYLRRPGVGRINFKPYWRTLEQWSARKLRQQIRSRRQRQKAARRPA